ncbi:MAG: tetratricopeptide repeat protein, partial [Planctomycetota bacterium]
MKALPLLLCPLLLLLDAGAEEDDPLAEARRHFHLRDHHLAERALVERGDDVEALTLLADVLLRSGRAEQASTVIERARKLEPEDPLLVAGSWEARLEARDWSDEAKAEVRKDVDAFLAATPEEGQDWRLVAVSIGYGLLDAKKAQEK